MKKRVADIVTEVLVENGITTCFSVVGGGAMHLNNAFALNDNIKKVFNHHEQASAMAAEGYARWSGKMAAVCVTSGPGAINAMNGVHGAWVDSIPMIVISGHPRYSTTVAPTDLHIRCRGVQEFDVVASVHKMTKYSKLIIDPLLIKCEMQKAIDIAMDGRRGPVWIDIPLDVQATFVYEKDLIEPSKYISDIPNVGIEQIKKLEKWISDAKRPCILTGSGIRTGNAFELFNVFLSKMKIPIVGGALQADICNNQQNLYYGMSGSMGPRPGNFILQNADLILVLGNSLSFKQTGFNQSEFAQQAKIIMIDAVEDEGKKPGICIDYFIHAELKDFFSMYNRYGNTICSEKEWLTYCSCVKNKFLPYEALRNVGEVSKEDRVPVLLFWKKFLKTRIPGEIITLGNSSCVHGVLQEGINFFEQRVLVNYNCGSMGDDLPQAIGAAVASNSEIYCITGDGSIMMNLQELQTIKHYNTNIKIIIFMNEGYGALRQTWSNFFDGKYTGCDSESGVSFPQFGKIANAFGFDYYQCDCVGQLDDCLIWLKKQIGPAILGIKQKIDDIKGPRLESKMLDDGTFVTPALHDMSPYISDEEMKELMIDKRK